MTMLLSSQDPLTHLPNAETIRSRAETARLCFGIETAIDSSAAQEADGRIVEDFLNHLHLRQGVDFSVYKMPTIIRRLRRRMTATGCQTLEEYATYVQQNVTECHLLVSHLLIKVTRFFRDPELFDYIRTRVLPDLITTARRNNAMLRLWSAGCATGEEAYSLAILVADLLGDELETFHVRIFATDLDATAIAFARRGVYPAAALRTLSPDLIGRCFTTLPDGRFALKPRLRNLTVFGQHDLGQSVSFMNIDLCLCRNVLIYFAPTLQRRVLQLFAFSVRHHGYLALGKAETPNLLPGTFVPIHPHIKVYQRSHQSHFGA